MKRNKFGCPLNVNLNAKQSAVLRRSRQKDNLKQLSEEELQKTIDYFNNQFPEQEVVKPSEFTQDDTTTEPTIEEMKSALKDMDVKISPNIGDDTLLKKYKEVFDKESEIV